MIEFFRHLLGFCGEHFHPNVWTLAAGSPFLLATFHYIKCRCGEIFSINHKCKNN